MLFHRLLHENISSITVTTDYWGNDLQIKSYQPSFAYPAGWEILCHLEQLPFPKVRHEMVHMLPQKCMHGRMSTRNLRDIRVSLHLNRFHSLDIRIDRRANYRNFFYVVFITECLLIIVQNQLWICLSYITLIYFTSNISFVLRKINSGLVCRGSGIKSMHSHISKLLRF